MYFISFCSGKQEFQATSFVALIREKCLYRFHVQVICVILQEHLMQRDRLLQNKIHQAFRRSEHQLLKALEARKAEVKVRDN